MLKVSDDTTYAEAFAAAVLAFGDRPFLAVPAGAHRPYHPDGFALTFKEAAGEVAKLQAAYEAAGFGHGHRVAMLLDNRPEHLLHKLALNSLGVCVAPINPDYRPAETAYLLEHSEPDLAIVAPERRAQLEAGIAAASWKPPVAPYDDLSNLPRPKPAPLPGPVTGKTPSSILYTSGTTGRPKGCVLSHGYELDAGIWYATRGGMCDYRESGERIYSPLPLYHVNSSVMVFACCIVGGHCQIQIDRFHPERWWREVRESGATVVHYLGVIAPLLLGQPESPQDRDHKVRFGIGAGVEPTLHAAFEERFGFPLVEVWGMTECVRILIDNDPKRPAGTRCFGKSVPGLEVRLVDDKEQDVPVGTPGEMLVRHSAETPRRSFFSEYLNNEEATKEAWRNGWFHTGDMVRQAPDGSLFFVDRKKNIIRRSGENIAAAEIEAVLQAHPLVKQVAILAAPDAVREEEVFACIILEDGNDPAAAAETLFSHSLERMAYYKAPGWFYFTDFIPTTGTQKIQKHQIFPNGEPPFDQCIDMRARKKRNAQKESA
jgi:acyl-CoA synthetase (AMP-forming)/AMP-acid ligase II